METLETTARNEDSRREDVEFDLLDLSLVLARKWKTILRNALAAGILTAVIVLLIPNQYTAVTKLLQPKPPASMASTLMTQFGGVFSLMGGEAFGLRDQTELYREMLKSRSIADALIQRFNLMKLYKSRRISDCRDQLEEHTAITLEKGGLIAIEFTDRDPNRAAAIANAYADELEKVMKRTALDQSSQRRAFFERELDDARQQVADAESAFKATQQKTGVLQLDAQARVMLEAAARLRSEIASREVILQSMRAYATDQSPDVVRRQSELNALRGQLSDLETKSDGKGLVAFGSMPESGLEYLRRLRDVKYGEAIYKVLAEQYEAAKLDEANTVSSVQVLDTAVPPDRKSKPMRTIITLGVSFSVALLTMAVLLLRDRSRRLLADPMNSERLALLRSYLRIRSRVI